MDTDNSNTLPTTTSKYHVDFDTLDKDESLRCMLILLQKMCNIMVSKSQFEETLKEVVAKSKEENISDETIKAILRSAIKERHSNSLNAALDAMGNFW